MANFAGTCTSDNKGLLLLLLLLLLWGAMSSAGVGPLCFLKTNSHCTHSPRTFGALHASFC